MTGDHIDPCKEPHEICGRGGVISESIACEMDRGTCGTFAASAMSVDGTGGLGRRSCDVSRV